MIKKILKRFEKKLGIDYMNDFLRRKGIATSKCGEYMITFKLYDYDWDILYKEGKMNVRCFFTLGDDIHMDSMIKAMNALNGDRFAIKAYLDEVVSRDEAGNPIKDAQTRTDINFSFEHFCYTESAFDDLYEFAIYVMTDAIEFHKKAYNKYLTENTTHPSPTIGFHSADEQSDEMSVTTNHHECKRIGFM